MSAPSPSPSPSRRGGDKALKVKNLLAAYYQAEGGGIGNDQDLDRVSTPTMAGSATTGISPSRSIAESDIMREEAPLDSSLFNPDAHLHRLIKEARLGTLVSQHRALAAEVGALDSDMQTLVYENYNKFIIATDIIRALDDAIGGLETRLSQLEALIGGAVRRSEAINGTLEQRQATIIELKETKQALQQLSLLLHTPHKLRAAVSQGAYEIAVEIYEDVAPVVKKHGHRRALKKVAADIENSRREVSERLRKQLVNKPEAAAEIIQLIARLDESTDSLIDDFLGSRRRRLSVVLLEGERQLSAVTMMSHASTTLNVLDFTVETLETLNTAFIPEVRSTALLFSQLFVDTHRPRLLSELREWFLRFISVVRSALENASTLTIANAVGIDAAGGGRKKITQSTQEEGGGSGSQGGGWGEVDVLAHALGSIRSHLLSLEPSLPELSPRDKAAELATNIVRHHINTCFTAIEARWVLELEEIRSSIASLDGAEEKEGEKIGAAQRMFPDLSFLAVKGFDAALHSVCQWTAHGWTLEGWKEVFFTQIQAQASNWLRALSQQCLVAVDLEPRQDSGMASHPVFSLASSSTAPTATHPPSSLFILFSSVFSFSLHTRLANRTEKMVSQVTYGAIAPGWVGEAIAYASSTASKLVETYKAACATAAAQIATTAVETTVWATYAETRAPRAVCITLLDAFRDMDGEIRAAEHEASTIPSLFVLKSVVGAVHNPLYHPYHSRQSTGGSGSAVFAGGDGGGEGGASNSRMGPGPSSANPPQTLVPWACREDLLSTAIQAALHAHATALRRHTLSRAAFQQIQLDCHYLRPQLQRILGSGGGGGGGEAGALAALDELLVVAAERCGEPVMLEPAMLDRMVASFQQQQQQQGRYM